MQLTTVFRSGNPVSIGLAQSLLEGAGIDFEIRGENSQHLLGIGTIGMGFNPLTGPAEIVVRAEDAERAEDLLLDLE